MVYIIKFKVDGGCRGNGGPNPYGAAAAVRLLPRNRHSAWTKTVRSTRHHMASNQRAEISAIILGLELAIAEILDLSFDPHVRVTIFTDSRYAVGCMTTWIYKWCRNGWVNAAGNEVANRDLIEKASSLDDWVKELGAEVEYVWISRAENELADEYANIRMDEMEKRTKLKRLM